MENPEKYTTQRECKGKKQYKNRNELIFFLEFSLLNLPLMLDFY